MGKMKGLILGLVCLFTASSVVAVSGYEAPKYQASPLRFHGSHITGSLRNVTDTMFNRVTIEFNLYNNRGALVGTAQTSVAYLEAGAYWSFDALTDNDEATSVKLIHVTMK